MSRSGNPAQSGSSALQSPGKAISSHRGSSLDGKWEGASPSDPLKRKTPKSMNNHPAANGSSSRQRSSSNDGDSTASSARSTRGGSNGALRKGTTPRGPRNNATRPAASADDVLISTSGTGGTGGGRRNDSSNTSSPAGSGSVKSSRSASSSKSGSGGSGGAGGSGNHIKGSSNGKVAKLPPHSLAKGKGAPPARTQYDVDSDLQRNHGGGLGSGGNSKSSSSHSSNTVPGIVEETASQAEGTPKPGSSKEHSGRDEDSNASASTSAASNNNNNSSSIGGNVTFAGGLSEEGFGSGTLSRGMTVSRRTGATNDHIARIKASESKSPGLVGWILDAMAHVFDDPDPAQLSSQQQPPPPSQKGELTARQKQLEETKTKSKKTRKKNHNAVNQPSVQRAKLIYMRRAAVANESLARQRAEDRFAQAAKPLGASWNDPLVKPHTASFGRALADMRIDELHGVSLCLEQIRDRVQQERALKKELVKQARGVERQSSATNATSPRGSSEDATKLRRSSMGGSVGGSGGGGQVMDPKFSEQLSPTEMANIRKAFKELDKDGSGSLDHHELVIGLKELKHPKPTLSTVMKMLAEVNLEKNDLISIDEFVIMWKNRQVSGGMLRSVQLAKAMGIIADPAVVHALLAVMASVIAEAQAKAKVRAARTNAGRASAQAALQQQGQQQEQQQTGEVPPSAVTVEQMQLPWEGPPPGVSELQGNRLLRELGGPYDPSLPLTGCMAYHARRLMMAAEEQEEKAAAAAKSGKTSGKSTPKPPSGGGSKTPKNGGSGGSGMKDSSEAQKKREIKDRLQEEALQGVKSEAPEASNSSNPTRGSGGVIAHCLPKSFFKSHDEWRNSSLTFDPRTRVLSCRATPYGIDRATAAQALTLAQTSLKASALASPAGSVLDGSVPPPPSPPLVPPNGTGPDLPPLLWARTVGEEEPAEALEDPVSTIHGYFYVMFSTAPESLNEATGDEATGVAAKARGILVAAPSEAVRRLWVDTLNGHVDTPVGGLYSPLASPLHEVGSSGGSGNGGEAGMRAVAEGSSSSGGAPVAGEGLEDESIAPASAVASVRGVDDGNGDDDIDEKEEDNNHVDDKSVGEEDEESGDREGAFGAFDLLEGGLGGLLSPAQEALYRDLESAEAVRDQGLVGAGQPPGKSRSNRGIGREERI